MGVNCNFFFDIVIALFSFLLFYSGVDVAQQVIKYLPASCCVGILVSWILGRNSLLVWPSALIRAVQFQAGLWPYLVKNWSHLNFNQRPRIKPRTYLHWVSVEALIPVPFCCGISYPCCGTQSAQLETEKRQKFLICSSTVFITCFLQLRQVCTMPNRFLVPSILFFVSAVNNRRLVIYLWTNMGWN